MFLAEATNFKDIELKDQPDWLADHTVPCPKCKGHGYWNLTLDAYGPGKHFQSLCG